MPFISVIVPVYNGIGSIQTLLNALSDQTYSSSCYEIIVVDDGSKDNTADFIKQIYPEIKTLTQDNGGSYKARNTGVSSSKGVVLAFTDADCIPAPDWIEKGITALTSHKVDIIAGGISMLFNNSNSAVEKYDANFGLNQEYYATTLGFGATANLFTYRKIFDDVSGFDDTLYSGGDQKFCNQAIACGARLKYSPDVLIQHPTRKSLKSLSKKTIRVAKGRALMAPNIGYYFPRTLSVFPALYYNYKNDKKTMNPFLHSKYIVLHYYQELLRIIFYSKTRLFLVQKPVTEFK